MTDLAVWRMARRLIELHGENAPRVALASVGLLLECSDVRRAAQWRSVSDAAATLLRARRQGGDPVP